jgi:hypothetical protein
MPPINAAILGGPRPPPVPDKPEENVAQAQAEEGDLLEDDDEADEDEQSDEGPERVCVWRSTFLPLG